MVINEREIKILEKFYNEKQLSIDNLSKEFKVSKRMIRYNIENINLLLKLFKIPTIKKQYKGTYLLEIKSIELLEIMKKLEPISKVQRQKILEMYCLFYVDKIMINDLVEKFQISRITINNDINEINGRLKINNLKIVNSNGLSVKGYYQNIIDYKILILSSQIEYLLDRDDNKYSNMIKEIIFKLISENNFKKVKKILNEIIDENKIKLNDTDYNNIYSKMINIFIGNKVSNSNEINILKDELKFLYLTNLLKKYKIYKLLSDRQIMELYDVLLDLKSYNEFDENNNFINIEILVKNIIKVIENKIKVKITSDKLLEEFLIQHFKAMIHRSIKGEKLGNYFINEKKEKDNLYNIIKDSLVIIGQFLKNEIDEDEIHLLKIHFLSSIDRIKKLEYKPIEVAVVTSLGPGSKQILLNNIKSKFLINVVYVGPLYQLPNILKKYKNISYILTTVELQKLKYKEKEVIKINPILTYEDEEKLLNLGFKINRNKINLSDLIEVISESTNIRDEEKLIKKLITNFGDKIVNDLIEFSEDEEIIKQDNIIFDSNEDNILDAIKKSCKLLEGEYTSPNYTEEMINAFKENTDYIIRHEGVMLLHVKNNGNVYKSGVSILKLSNPLFIYEDDKNPRNEKIEIIVSFSIKNNKNIGNKMSNVINKVFRNQFKKLLKTKNKEVIIDYLEN